MLSAAPFHRLPVSKNFFRRSLFAKWGLGLLILSFRFFVFIFLPFPLDCSVLYRRWCSPFLLLPFQSCSIYRPISLVA